MVRKLLVLGVALIMCLGLFAGCGEDIATDKVAVMIKTEYRDKFLAEEFTIADFDWDNIDEITYHQWYEIGEKGWVTISLKKHGKKQAKDAVKHFNTLDFVDSAETIGFVNAD